MMLLFMFKELVHSETTVMFEQWTDFPLATSHNAAWKSPWGWGVQVGMEKWGGIEVKCWCQAF